eukprot:7422916-Pyramimonas_sp.AAC.1
MCIRDSPRGGLGGGAAVVIQPAGGPGTRGSQLVSTVQHNTAQYSTAHALLYFSSREPAAASRNTTSFVLGFSCASNGKGARNAPERSYHTTIIITLDHTNGRVSGKLRVSLPLLAQEDP